MQQGKAGAWHRGIPGFFAFVGRNAFALVKVNLLFCCFSLLLVTLGPSLAAMAALLDDLCRGRTHDSVSAAFWDAFAVGLRRSFPCGMVWGALLFAGASGLRSLWGTLSPGQWNTLPLFVLCLLALGLLAVWGSHLLLLLPAADMPLGKLLGASLALTIARPFYNAFYLVLAAALGALLLCLGITGLLLALVAGFALAELILVWGYAPAVHRYLDANPRTI